MTSIPGLIVGTIAGVVVAIVLFKVFFEDGADFWECVKYGFMPDFFSWLNGDLQRDYGKSMKLGIYISLCAGFGCAAYFGIESLK